MRLLGRSARHMLLALAEASLIALIVVALVSAPAFAGKGGAKGKVSGTDTLAGPVLVSDADGDGSAGHLDWITFTVETTATDRPFVGLRCYQGSAFVYDGYVGYFPTYMYDEWFVLSSPYWEATLSADCTARLFYYDRRGNQRVLSTLDFAVTP